MMNPKSDIRDYLNTTAASIPPRRRQAHYMDGVIFAVAVIALCGLCIDAAYDYGYAKGQDAKKCATVPGEKVVSTTAGTCTYANAYGWATKTRRTM